MPENTPAVAAPVTATANSDSSAEIKTLILDLQNQIKAIQTPPVTATPQVTITREGLNDLLAQKCGNDHAKRYAFLRENWETLAKSYPLVHNANTDTASGALTPGILSSGLITVATNRLAPLNAFTRNFTSGRIGRNVIYIPKVTAGGTAQSNPTSFEDATNFVNSVDDIPITPAHLVSGGHITNAELQNGWRMAWWTENKIGELSDKVQAAVNAIITTTNYASPEWETFAATAFGSDELKIMWANIKKARQKSILLDGEYYANFLPNNLESFNPLSGNSYPGWDNFYLNTYWTGATTNTVGFACGPNALCVGAGLPNTAPGEERMISRTAVTLPDLGISIDVCNWFATSARVSWATFELMFGAAAGDTTTGNVLLSA